MTKTINHTSAAVRTRPPLAHGTAAIAPTRAPRDWYVVNYTDVSGLRGEPLLFRTKAQAGAFCRSRKLRIIKA